MELIAKIETLDKEITFVLNSLNSPVSDWIWLAFSHVKIWYILYLVVLVFFFIRLGWKKALMALAACVLMVVCCDQGANLIKDLVARVRPCNDPDMLARGIHVLENGGGFSFFSAHAANSIGFAACSYECFKWDGKKHKAYAWGIFAWAALVSVSRVFVARHFLGDVLVGVAVGLVVGTALGRLFGYLCRKFTF